MRERRLVGLVVAAVTAALLTGCAAIPTSGPVREGGDIRPGRGDAAVPFIGAPPLPGASPGDVVLGFLRASADFVNDHEVARLYLAPAVRQQWRPGVGTAVYDRSLGPPAVSEGDGTVTITGTQVAQIDRQGRYRRTPVQAPLQRAFRLQRVDGEWRITQLDDGLVLSSVDVRETFRQVSLYFLAPAGNVLVPDTVLLPELPGMSSRLVSRLLRGPSAWLSGAVRSAFPQGTSLEVSSVPVRDGLATVRLNAAALKADDDARERMSAQIVWTLKQLPEVLRVRITVGGDDLVLGGVGRDQGRDSWATYDPDGLAGSSSPYVARDGRIGRVMDDRFEPVPGLAGTGEIALRSPAVNLDSSRIAAVSADGRSVVVGRLAANAGLEARLAGTDLGAPSWDPEDNLWMVDRGTGAVWLLPDGAERVVQVSVPRLPGGPPSGLAVARDGARLAMITGLGREARLVVGAVLRADDAGARGGDEAQVPPSVGAFAEVLPGLQGLRDVAWADADTLIALGSRDGLPVAPVSIDSDGYDVAQVEPLRGLVSLAAAPPRLPLASPLVGGTSDGRLRQYTSGRGWVVLGAGSDPAYPG